MRKLTKKSQLILYACSGLGVNMLNSIMGSYLCSAVLVGGFESQKQFWTFENRDLVLAGVWATLILVAKILDGIIDVPFSHFTDNIKTKWGKRRPALLIGFIPMVIAYVLFLFPPQPDSATLLNTIWLAAMLFVFYGFYTLTMLTYYATFSEITENPQDIALLSNAKSVCDVIYFSLSYALVPVFINFDINIKWVALMFLPLSLTMMIPMFMIKEDSNKGETSKSTEKRVTVIDSFKFTIKDKPYISWLCVLFIMNMGLQLFLSGINEYFSTAGINMTFVMASCFVPVPLTILIYNKIIKKKGFGFAYRYILLVYSVGMGLMAFCKFIPQNFIYPYAIGCSIVVSFAIGSFFSVTYMIPTNRASLRLNERASAPSMYFAIQGLFEGASAGLASGVILVFLKQNGLVPYMTTIIAAICMSAFALSFLLPKSITQIGKTSDKLLK